MQITEEENTYLLCIQEPYTIQNDVVGIPNKYRTYTFPGSKCGAAILVTNMHIDGLPSKLHSEADSVVAEITIEVIKLILTSMYFEIGRQIVVDLSKIEAELQYANGVAVLLAIDINTRTASSHVPTTKSSGSTRDE